MFTMSCQPLSSKKLERQAGKLAFPSGKKWNVTSRLVLSVLRFFVWWSRLNLAKRSTSAPTPGRVSLATVRVRGSPKISDYILLSEKEASPVMQSNLAEKLEHPEGESLEGLNEEERRIVAALRDPVKGPKLRKVMEDSLNG